VFVVDEQENIINRVPAYERLVTGKKRRNPHEVTNLMKNTGSHNGYLRFEHEANGGKKLWQTMKIRVNSHRNQSGIRKNGEESQNHRRTQTIRGRRNSKCQK